MPVELIHIKKGGERARCERFQLAAMQARGWEVTTPPAPEPAPDAPPAGDPPGLVRVYKGEHEGWAEPGKLPPGWSREPPAEPDEPEGEPDLRAMLENLDPEDDELWAGSGKVAVRVVNERFGLSLTHGVIEEAWPGFCRDSLR